MAANSTRMFETKHDWSNTAPSIAVIDAISAIENREPTNLADTFDTTLFDRIDPEALDDLLAGGGEITVSFSYGEYRIRIDESTLRIVLD